MDSDTQNTSGLSVNFGNENVHETDSQREGYGELGYKKNEWLMEFFVKVKKDDKILVECRNCGKQFRNRSHSRMITHARTCPKSHQEIPMDRSNISDMNLLFAQMMIETGWSLKGMETKSFRTFMHRLNRSWIIPCRKDISANYYPYMSEMEQIEFKKKLNQGVVKYISLEFDHWEDANNRSFLGILATCEDGYRHLIDLRDVSLKGHSTSVIVEEVMSALKDIPKNSINSFVSDSASSCKKARQELVSTPHFKHAIQHRCLAHFTNLIGSRLETKNYTVSATIKLVSKIIGFISNSTYWTAYIREQNLNRVNVACSVRWYSTVEMLQGILNLKNVIVEDIQRNLDRDRARSVSELDWDLIERLCTLLKPLCKCIGEIEGRNCSLGTGINSLLQYAKDLFRENNAAGLELSFNSPELSSQAREAFLFYMSEEKVDNNELGLWLASYALDRRYKMDYLTEEGKKLCFETIALLAVKTGTTLQQVKATLLLEFDYYTKFRNQYKPTTSKPEEWWQARLSSGPLAQVGLRLAHLKASSANIERAFSSVKYIQGDYRLNLSNSTLLHVSRLKISTKNSVIVENSHSPQEDHTEDHSDDTFNTSQSSTITISQSSSWIQDFDLITKKSYQRFCKYIDFSIINNFNELDTSDTNISEEEVLACVRSCLESGQSSRTVIVEDFPNESEQASRSVIVEDFCNESEQASSVIVEDFCNDGESDQ